MGYARYGEDADAYWGRKEREVERYPRCAVCGQTLFPGVEAYQFDVPFNGKDIVCPDCLTEYLSDHGYRADIEEFV